MALFQQHFVEKGLAWAASRLHVLPTPAAMPALRAAPPIPPNAKALARATALYSGQEVLTSEDFISLEWLASFVRSGRQLLMCHALRLLESWHGLRRSNHSIETEAGILAQLVFAAGQSAALLPEDQHVVLSLALQSQVNRLLHMKSQGPTLLRIKAMALLEAAEVMQKAQALQAEAMQLLEQALPQLIRPDGSPACDSLPRYVAWLHPLLTHSATSFSTKAQNALDRAGPFLAMLLRADGHYCFDAAIEIPNLIHNTAALRHAPAANMARLATAKSVAIAAPGQLNISANNHFILKAGFFLHGPDDDHATRAMECDCNKQGQWFHQETAHQRRTVFLCAKGDDLRIEDHIEQLSMPGWMRLEIADHAKVSLARNGTQATIALDARNLWQLTVRGAELIAPQQGQQWLARTTNARVNWALKRLSRSPTRQGKRISRSCPSNWKSSALRLRAGEHDTTQDQTRPDFSLRQDKP